MISEGATRTTVLLVDDHAIFRQGTKGLLARAPDIDVVGETDDGCQAVSLAEKLRPDVVLLDIRIKGQNGVETARQIRSLFPEIKIVALTSYDFEPYVKAMMKIGAEGYLLKDCPPDQIIDGIRTVSRGGTVFTSSIARKVILGYLKDSDSEKRRSSDALSARELEILHLLADGKKNAEISEALYISLSTVESHITALFSKLRARSRTEAVSIAAKRGLVVLEPEDTQ